MARGIRTGWHTGFGRRRRTKPGRKASQRIRLHVSKIGSRATPGMGKPLGRRQLRKLGLLPKPNVVPLPDGTHRKIEMV